jgi:hypothetical protein
MAPTGVQGQSLRFDGKFELPGGPTGKSGREFDDL